MARVRLAFLGPPLIELDGAPVHLDTRKAVALVAYLAETAEPVSRDTLVTLLWSRYGRAGGHAALRRTLSTLRSALGKGLLDAERETVRLVQSPDLQVDISRSRDLLALCGSHAHGRQEICRGCLPVLSEAAGLFRGEFLAGFTLKDSVDFDDWQFFTTEKYRLEAVHMLDKLVLCHAAAGDFGSAISFAHRRLGVDRMDESAHAMLMRLHAWGGNRAAASHQFEECRRMLGEELDSPPKESTVRLAEAIARGEPPEIPVFASEWAEREKASAAEPFTESAFSTVLAVATPPAGEGYGETIARYHGQLIESSESGFLALFGDGRFLESNPELAIRAALEMREVAGESSHPIRGAVTTGYLSRAAGESTLRFAGRAVPLARLLAERAPEGALLVDQHTYRLTRDAFSFAPVAEGRRSSGRPTFGVLGLAPVSRKSRGPFGPHSEMIGREEEAARLTHAFERTAGGNGQVVVITGEAGIGKSRLVHELYHRVSDTLATGGVRWLEGRCLSPKTNIGYWPFIDMIGVLDAEQRARTTGEDETESFSRESLDEILAQKADGGPGRVRSLVSAADELLGHWRAGPHRQEIDQWGPEQVKHRAFNAVTLLFRELSRQVPLVLVFEDLHWADTLSLDLIDSLLDSSRGLRIVLVLVYRIDPDHRSRILASSAARRRLDELTEIHLREITREEGSQMLDALVPAESLPASVRESILQSCRGNPYFLEELARATATGFQEAEELPPPDPSAGEANRSTLSQGIKSVVLSRFFNLSETEQEVLSHAAVIGRVFLRRLLALAVERDDLGAILEDLEDRELLFIERSVPEVEYSFKHALTQEAVYESISVEDRLRLHRKAAHAYQRLSPSARTEYSESLAYHYDRGKEVEKAIDFYYVSGEKARQGYANSAAVAHFTRGLELLRASPQGAVSLDRELEFLISLGVPLVLAKGHQDPTVEAVHLRAKAICEERGSPLQRFLVNLGLNRHYSYSRQRLHYGQQMLDIARGMGDERLISRAHGMLAESFFYFGDFPEMRAHAEAGQAHCQPAGSSLDLIQFGNDTSAIVMITRSLALWGFGFMTQSAEVMQEDLTRARTLGHAFTLCMVIFYACLLSFMRREQHEARPLSEELFSLAQREGFALYIGYGLVLRGWSGGDPRLIRRGIEMLPRHPFPCAYACMLAELYLADGRTDSAIETLDNALTQVRETHLHLWEPEVHRLRGEAGRVAGEPDEDTDRWFQRSLRLSQKQKAKCLELRATMSLYRRGLQSGSTALRGQLEALYGSFTEGRASADLSEARRLLDGLPLPPSPEA